MGQEYGIATILPSTAGHTDSTRQDSILQVGAIFELYAACCDAAADMGCLTHGDGVPGADRAIVGTFNDKIFVNDEIALHHDGCSNDRGQRPGARPVLFIRHHTLAGRFQVLVRFLVGLRDEQAGRHRFGLLRLRHVDTASKLCAVFHNEPRAYNVAFDIG